MSEQGVMDEWRNQIRQNIEELATQVVLAEDLARPLAILRRIVGQARKAGVARLEELAGELLKLVTESAAGEDAEQNAPWEAIGEGVLKLQQALQEAGAPERASTTAAESAWGQGQIARDPELLRDFVVEAREHLAAIEGSLLELEHAPENAEALHATFRGFHTIKGLAGFLELGPVQQVAHEVETLLDLARNQRLKVTPEFIDLALKGADYLRAAVDQLEASLAGKPLDGFADARPLIEALRRLAGGGDAGSQQTGAPLADSSTTRSGPPDGEPDGGQSGVSSARTVKVDTTKLDHLVDMVGELVIAQSMLRHDPDLALSRNPRLQRTLSLLSGITSDVQKTAMSLRMITVASLFRRMGRLVRDLSRKTGKQVELVTSGEETELDRQIVEELADPIMHMVRNSIDHGLEPPEERVAAGKPPVGKVMLSAYHQSGQIVIEVADDGRGLDREKILKRGRAMGLVPEGVVPPDAELFNLIFEPGFSTAEKVTEVSGRGVGMDVVKRNITRMRGKVEVSSQPGRGTKFTLKLPLTLAIIDGLVVGVGSQRYVIPIYSVVEMLVPARDSVTRVPEQGEMVLIRGSLLPVIRLHERFQVEAQAKHPSDGLLVVAEREGKRFSVLVDEFLGKQEVVIKSLGPMFRHVRGIAGGAILGDGRVGLILDLDSIYSWKEAA